jgi:hypothetical protein
MRRVWAFALTVTVFWLFQSREWLQLKVLEVHPELTKLGASLKEASELQRAHDEVLLQLQVQRHGILSRSAMILRLILLVSVLRPS